MATAVQCFEPAFCLDLRSAGKLRTLMNIYKSETKDTIEVAKTSLARTVSSSGAGDAEQSVGVAAMNGGAWKVPSTEWAAFTRGIAGALAVNIPFYLTERFPKTGLFRLAIDVDYDHKTYMPDVDLVGSACSVKAEVKKCVPSADVDALDSRLECHSASCCTSSPAALAARASSVAFTCTSLHYW